MPMAEGKPGRRVKGAINGNIVDQCSGLSELLVAWNPLGLKLPAAELPDAYNDLTDAILWSPDAGWRYGWMRQRAIAGPPV